MYSVRIRDAHGQLALRIFMARGKMASKWKQVKHENQNSVKIIQNVLFLKEKFQNFFEGFATEHSFY